MDKSIGKVSMSRFWRKSPGLVTIGDVFSDRMIYFTADELPQGLNFKCYYETLMDVYADCPDEFDDSVFGSI